MYKLTEHNIIIKTENDITSFIPVDDGNLDYIEYLQWVSLGNTAEPAYTESEIFEKQKNELTQAVQQHLDQVAVNHGYDSIISACSYAGVSNAFQQDGIDFLNWRASCWTTANQVLNDVTNNIIPIPTAEELILLLPTAPS
jgi:hypothetical protein